ANTEYVQRWLNLDADGPLFAVVSRLVQQKGIDLTLEVAEHIVARGGRIGVIGQGEPALEAAMADLGRRHPGRVGVHIGFNERDARRLYAGSDFLLMPSRFEPCGLSQMYAQRYASLPIARCTGGLADTIEDGVSGFLFDAPHVDAYREAIDRALQVFEHPELLEAMRCRAMRAPLYWRQSVQPYDRLFQRLLGQVSARRALRCCTAMEPGQWPMDACASPCGRPAAARWNWNCRTVKRNLCRRRRTAGSWHCWSVRPIPAIATASTLSGRYLTRPRAARSRMCMASAR